MPFPTSGQLPPCSVFKHKVYNSHMAGAQPRLRGFPFQGRLTSIFHLMSLAWVFVGYQTRSNTPESEFPLCEKLFSNLSLVYKMDFSASIMMHKQVDMPTTHSKLPYSNQCCSHATWEVKIRRPQSTSYSENLLKT